MGFGTVEINLVHLNGSLRFKLGEISQKISLTVKCTVPLFYPTLILPQFDFTPPLTLPHLLLCPTIYFTPASTIPHPIIPPLI